MARESETMPDLFGGTLPPALSPQEARARRDAESLLLAIPPLPGCLWIDKAAEDAARELVRTGRASMTWLQKKSVYELQRVSK